MESFLVLLAKTAIRYRWIFAAGWLATMGVSMLFGHDVANHLIPFGTQNAQASRADLIEAELKTFPVVFLVLLFAFGNVAGPFVPFVLASAVITTGFGAIALFARFYPLSDFTLNAATMIGLGISIDYTLLLVNRFRQELSKNSNIPCAVEQTMRSSGKTVCIAGAILAVSSCGLFLFSSSLLVSIGIGIILVSSVAILASITLMPSLLAIMGRKILLWPLPIFKIREASTPKNKLTLFVLKHPLLAIFMSLVILIGIASFTKDISLSNRGFEHYDDLWRDFGIVIAAILSLSFILLVLFFRSLLLPLKAVLINLLSTGAAYGMLVIIFPLGIGNILFGGGIETIHVTIPIILFVVLYALGLDYEIFIIKRIQEKYQEHQDNERAIREGMAQTSRIVWYAALAMIVVFGAFSFGHSALVRQIGMGLAIAVLIDATVARLIFVPAAMKLMGRWNWWFPFK